MNGEGQARVLSAVDGDGYPRVNLLGDDGNARVAIRALPDGGSRVTLLNGEGRARASLSAGTGFDGPDAATLNLWAPDGPVNSMPMVHLGVDHGQSGEEALGAHLMIGDSQRARIVLGVDDGGDATITLLDADGNVTWSAP